MKHRQVAISRAGVLNNDGHAIGLDIGATGVRAAVLVPGILEGRPSVTMHAEGQVALPPGTVVNGVVQRPAPLTAAIKQLWHDNKFECNRVILGIANQQVVVRDLTVPDLTPQQRAKALPFQAREIVALPIDQVVLDFCPLSEADPLTNTITGLLLATPREPVLNAVAAVERAGLKVGRVDLSSLGVLRSIGDEDLTIEALVDLGAHLTTIVIHDRGVPKVVRTLARGGQEITEQLAERAGKSVEDAELAKCEIGLLGDEPGFTRTLSDALRPLIAEIRTTLQYFRSLHDGAVVTRMSLTGGGAALPGIAERLSDQLGLPIRVVDPMQHVRNRYAHKPTHGVGSSTLSAVSVGLAMGASA